MGIDIAQAALVAGHSVVATGRDAGSVSRRAIGAHENLFAVALDVTYPAAAERRPRRQPSSGSAHRRAGQQRRQLVRRLLRDHQPRADPRPDGDQLLRPPERDPCHPPGAARQRSGQIITITSTAGLIGSSFSSAYAASSAPRRQDEVVALRRRTVRHLHDGRRARVLPHRAARRGRIHDPAGTATSRTTRSVA